MKEPILHRHPVATIATFAIVSTLALPWIIGMSMKYAEWVRLMFKGGSCQ